MPAKPSSTEFADAVSDVLYELAGWLLVGLGVAASLAGLGGLVGSPGTTDVVVPGAVLLFGLLFTASGLLVNPRARRRLDRRHAPTRFGRIPTVDSRVLSASENRTESCVACGSAMHEGLVRRYRQEYAVAGVPVWTASEHANFYCSTCAVEELPALSRTDPEDDPTDGPEFTDVE